MKNSTDNFGEIGHKQNNNMHPKTLYKKYYISINVHQHG